MSEKSNKALPLKTELKPRKIIFCILFTSISIGINYLGSFLAGLIAFPLYLDSVMTIAATALCGLVPGLICAFFSNLLLYFFFFLGIFFTVCHLSTALIAWLVFRAERKKAKAPGGVSANEQLLSADSFMWAGFLFSIINSIIGDSISNFVYGANTSIPQVDNAVQGIYVVIRSLPLAAYIGGTITNFVDKLISATICLFIYRGVKKIKL